MEDNARVSSIHQKGTLYDAKILLIFVINTQSVTYEVVDELAQCMSVSYRKYRKQLMLMMMMMRTHTLVSADNLSE
ncbi:hypothetical protein MTR_6g086245 [Medicago truncatula]|uniref:Uncharacterized protein n=1 Tax=Medicago truncatula TaxID=3880 RepID=A0A072UDC2_MEDTR|nr:hypothetical protein MTR_6g086245 [Medicago truncatula]